MRTCLHEFGKSLCLSLCPLANPSAPNHGKPSLNLSSFGTDRLSSINQSANQSAPNRNGRSLYPSGLVSSCPVSSRLRPVYAPIFDPIFPFRVGVGMTGRPPKTGGDGAKCRIGDIVQKLYVLGNWKHSQPPLPSGWASGTQTSRLGLTPLLLLLYTHITHNVT